MAAFTTKLSLGTKAYVVRGGYDLDPYIEPMTVGQIRVIETHPKHLHNTHQEAVFVEEYMCVETGIGSGSIWRYGYNIFATEAEAQGGLIAARQRLYKQRAERDAERAKAAEERERSERAQFERLKARFEQQS